MRVNSSPQRSSAAHVNTPKMSQLARAEFPPRLYVRLVINYKTAICTNSVSRQNNISQEGDMFRVRRRLSAIFVMRLGLSARGAGQPLRCFSLPKFLRPNLALGEPSISAQTNLTLETSLADDHFCLYPSSLVLQTTICVLNSCPLICKRRPLLNS